MFRKLALSLAVAAGLISQLALPADAALGVGAFAPPAALAESLAGRKGAVRLGRPEVLLVQFGLARPGLVPVRLCVAARDSAGAAPPAGMAGAIQASSIVRPVHRPPVHRPRPPVHARPPAHHRPPAHRPGGNRGGSQRR